LASISFISRSKVIPGRHWSRGLSTIVVSIIPNGAGSVGVSARPFLPNTDCTSGNALSSASICPSTRVASASDIPGGAVGMYRIAPSSSGGMNSLPMRKNAGIVNATTIAASTITIFRWRTTNRTTGV
jgi:hypothetical protein